MMEKLIILLKKFIGQKWFGKIEISIESGKIVNLKVTENIKL
jgi:hypothetical protein